MSQSDQPAGVAVDRGVRPREVPLPGGLRLTVTERCELYDWRDECIAEAEAAARSALEDECNRTDSLLTILGLPAERCRSEGGRLIPRKVLTLMGEIRARAYWPHFDEWWNSAAADSLRAAYPDTDGRDFQCIWNAASARHEDEAADALRFRWLCEHPDWHFVERLCREFVADSNMEFLVELRRVIDARRSVELGPLEEHMVPGA